MRINIFFATLLFVVVIPGIFTINILINTYSLGALVSALLILLIYSIKAKAFYIDKSFWYFLFYLFLIFLFSIYPILFFEWFDLRRFFLSYLLISIILAASFLFVNLSLETADEKVYKYVNIIFYLVLFDGIIFGISKIIDPTSINTFLFFFPEMSHFSLIFLPFLLFKIITSKSYIYIYSIITVSLLLALFAKSFTLLIGSIMVMLFYSVKKTSIFLIFFILLFLILSEFELISGYDFVYFKERIPHIDTNNVSVLVFLSGWERAYLNFSNYGLFGIGFNQLGIEGQIGSFQDKLSSFGLGSLNLMDGGSVAPKLISELGILGLVSLVVYIFYFIKITLKFKRHKFNYSNLEIFYISIFLMSSINLFARGSGYFSPIIILFLCSIIYYLKKNVKKTISIL